MTSFQNDKKGRLAKPYVEVWMVFVYAFVGVHMWVGQCGRFTPLHRRVAELLVHVRPCVHVRVLVCMHPNTRLHAQAQAQGQAQAHAHAHAQSRAHAHAHACEHVTHAHAHIQTKTRNMSPP